jgi:signal transduction histidine kinase
MGARGPRIPYARPIAATLALVGQLLVLVLLGLSFMCARRLEQARDRLDRDEEVSASLRRTLLWLDDAETSERGFLLTDRAAYLAPFERARSEVPRTLGALAGLLRDDAPQRSELAKLDRLANVKLGELSSTIELEKAGRHDRALAAIESGGGKETMDEIRDLDQSMRSTEEERAALTQASASTLARLTFAGLAAACCVILVIGLLMRAVTRELVQAEIAKVRITDLEDFAGRVAHDIRSPLASVALAVDLAKRRPGEVRAQSALERAARTMQRMSSLVDGLLVFAKAGARPAEGAEADVRAVASDVVEATRLVAEERGIAVELDDVSPTVVACGPGVLTSMLSNLVDNAIKYIGDGSTKRVSVGARSGGGTTHVEVRDTGPGVPREMRLRIFDPYVRYAAGPGLGLGLATVRRLAEAHGGAAGVAENAPTGSVFWFELPNTPERSPASRGR